MHTFKIHIPWLECNECGETEQIFQEGVEIYCANCGLVLHDLSICRPTLEDMEQLNQQQFLEDRKYYQGLLKTLHGNH